MSSPSILVTVSSRDFRGFSSALSAPATFICSHNWCLLVFVPGCRQTPPLTSCYEVAAYALTVRAWARAGGGSAHLLSSWLVLPLPLHTLPLRAGHKNNMLIFLQTTYKGKSSFQTYADYLKWETFLQQQLQLFPEGSALRHGFQTCEHWKQIFMEIIGK